MEESNDQSALEQFRKQWREEVNARSKHSGGGLKKSTLSTAEASRSDRPTNRQLPRHPADEIAEEEANDDSGAEGTKSSMIQRIEGLAIRDVDDDDFSAQGSTTDPTSALEHYERAVEKESQGSLGDSLSHYRKAYRLDARVDQSYKNKHFPAKSKPVDPNPSNAAVTVPSTAHHSSKEPIESLTVPELIETFAGIPISGASPMIEGDIPPPCPIKDLPSEVLLELLQQTAIRDPASFIRLSLVCKKLAYHVFTENSIWKRVALGSEFGFGSQVFDFTTDLHGHEAIERTLDMAPSAPITSATFEPDEDWREVFHSQPRIRFTGVYISTVNYTRAGGASASQVTWNTPVHIVTYYRYLRFFRDGTVLSLLTTSEPIEVVHLLTQENVTSVRNQGSKDPNHHLTGSLPPTTAPNQNLMKHVLRGRWRLCHPGTSPQRTVADIAKNGGRASGDVHIETEGAGPRYMYTMHLALRSSSKAPQAVKNNKLQWRGFWNHNSLTNDWGEFQLRNDKAFLFSRVKSYGLGY